MAHINYNLWSPLIRPNIAFDVVLDPPLRGVDILGPGTIFFQDVAGNQTSYSFAVGSISGFVRLTMQIEMIIGDGEGGVGDGVTGTNIPLAQLRGLR